MKISRNKKLVSDRSLGELFDLFGKEARLNEGTVSYSRFDLDELYDILPDAFTVSPELGRAEAINLFRIALIECRKNEDLNEHSIMLRAKNAYESIMARKNSEYIIWTKLPILEMENNKGFMLNFNGVNVKSGAFLPKYLQLDEYMVGGFGRIDPDKPKYFGRIIAKCEDRSEGRAVDRILDALQIIMGLFNIYQTWGRYTIVSDRHWTDGPICLGPHQFLFRDKSFIGREKIWYNPEYDERSWISNHIKMSSALSILPRVKNAIAKIERHPFKEVIVRSILLLQDGFATRDGNRRILRYWSALEQLYVESDVKMRSNEKILERAVFAERDPELTKWKLEHIARLRNGYVHSGAEARDINRLSQFLREMVARHINHWIHKQGAFADHNEFLQFLKLPADRNTLNKMQKMIDLRMKYIA